MISTIDYTQAGNEEALWNGQWQQKKDGQNNFYVNIKFNLTFNLTNIFYITLFMLRMVNFFIHFE